MLTTLSGVCLRWGLVAHVACGVGEQDVEDRMSLRKPRISGHRPRIYIQEYQRFEPTIQAGVKVGLFLALSHVYN